MDGFIVFRESIVLLQYNCSLSNKADDKLNHQILINKHIGMYTRIKNIPSNNYKASYGFGLTCHQVPYSPVLTLYISDIYMRGQRV